MKKLLATLTVTCLASTALAAPGDWPFYGHDASGGRFSSLTQITPANVGKLQVAWTYHMNPTPGAGRVATSTTTPLVVNNVVYLGTPFGRVVALDASSGQQIWAYQMPGSDQPAFRGLGYWPGEGKLAPRIIFGSAQGKLIALDAKTGEPAQGFGTDGVVDTRTPEIMNGLPNAYYS